VIVPVPRKVADIAGRILMPAFAFERELQINTAGPVSPEKFQWRCFAIVCPRRSAGLGVRWPRELRLRV
jgi:hypothetical protein